MRCFITYILGIAFFLLWSVSSNVVPMPQAVSTIDQHQVIETLDPINTLYVPNTQNNIADYEQQTVSRINPLTTKLYSLNQSEREIYSHLQTKRFAPKPILPCHDAKYHITLRHIII